MAEELVTIQGSKISMYESLIPQVKALLEGETDPVANLANCAAAIQQTFNYLWVGFYLVKNDELVLGPFQGPIACTRIQKGKGVCGSSWEQKKTLVVRDVDEFPGHIACSSDSKSEIVVPLIKQNKVVGVLDIDSNEIGTFDATDSKYLTQLCEWLVTII